MFALLIALAQAQEVSPPVVAQAGPSQAAEPVQQDPLYVMTRGALAVPFNGSGDIPAASVGLGLDIGDGQSIGLRAVYMNDVPPGTRAGDNPPPWAWGPMVDFNMRMKPQSTRSPYIHLSAGFVYGTEEGQENIVVPLGELGMGLQFDRQIDERRSLFLAPELGIIPSFFNANGDLINVEAPYAALSIGMRIK
jgi:hypothetical protein